jgi:hypothetical protein
MSSLFCIILNIMKSNITSILFFLLIIASCGTTEEKTEFFPFNDTKMEEEEDKKINIMIQRDQEIIDSITQVLLNPIKN